ncbi:MAG: NIL domain-containing protein [candidate division NC10 bacterium]|nr:NIL domain-containing protein [candidate division NC10 bacterium]
MVATLRVRLLFPAELVREPIIYSVATRHHLIPNLRKARVTERSGEAILDLSGDEESLRQGIEYLTGLGVKVKPLPIE